MSSLYKPRIKVDLDNVLNDMAWTMVSMYNADSNTILDYNRCDTYDFSCYGEIFQRWAWDVWENRATELYNQMRPPENAIKGLKKLCDDYDVVIATASFPWCFNLACQFIDKYYPWFPQSRIIKCNDKRWITTEYAIDDLPRNLVPDVVATRILVDQPWNRDFDDAWHDTFRVLDLVEAYDFIADFENHSDIDGGEDFDE